MTVRAHMSCRRWFQYQATELRAFHATVPISSVLSPSFLILQVNLWLQFSRFGSIVRWGALNEKAQTMQRSRENFVESFFPDSDFSLDFLVAMENRAACVHFTINKLFLK